jgi:sporulation protein YlmC with PRC-barrel domain
VGRPVEIYEEQTEMNIRTLCLTSAAAAMLTTGALAQNTTTDPVTPPAATSTTTESVQFTSTAGASQMAVSKLTGTDVRNAAGENLGDVNDVLVDNTGMPTVAIIGVGGFLGLGEKNVGVPFKALQFTTNNETNARVARLDVTKEALKAAPPFVYGDESNTAQTKTQ